MREIWEERVGLSFDRKRRSGDSLTKQYVDGTTRMNE